MTSELPLPTQEELDVAYDDLVEIHRRHLAQYGVRIFRKGTKKSYQLAMLYLNQGERVHKNTIAAVVQSIFGDWTDQQVRHLGSQDGWNVENIRGGYHILHDPTKPSATFVNARARRLGRLSAQSFEDLKAAYDYRCASCNTREGEVNPRYGAGAVQLQQGHKDPRGASDDMGNIIPQCQFCNQAYRGDFTFDDRGRVRAVADVGPVSRASESVQRRIWRYLKRKFQQCGL